MGGRRYGYANYGIHATHAFIIDDAMSSEEFPYRFYYHALNKRSQEAYEIFYDGLRRMESEIAIPLSPNDDVNATRAWVALKYDHPELDFVSENQHQRLDAADRVVFYPSYGYSKDEVKEATRLMNDYINSNFGDLLKLSSPYQRILLAHDRIAGSMSYDLESQSKNDDVFRIDGPILNGKGVCLGFAKLFMMVLNFLRIRNHIIVGRASHDNGLHAWNVVYFGNEAYHIDLTWDLKNEFGQVFHRNFMLPNKLIQKTHTFHPDFHIPDGRTNVLYPFFRKTAFRSVEEAIKFASTSPVDSKKPWEILLPTNLYTDENIQKIGNSTLNNPSLGQRSPMWYKFPEIQVIAIFFEDR